LKWWKVLKYGDIQGFERSDRRSSGLLCTNIVEVYRKRWCQTHFVSKETDCDMENTETLVWLDFSWKCNYIIEDVYQDKPGKSEEAGRLLQDMIMNPGKYDSGV
jgi:four helix bundle protein